MVYDKITLCGFISVNLHMATTGSFSEVLYLDGKVLKGIQSLSFEVTSPETNKPVMGRAHSQLVTFESPPSVSSRVNKVLLNTDFMTGLIDKTGSNREMLGFSGGMFYGDNLMEFNTGVLDGFSITANTSDIPEIAFDFTIYGSMTGRVSNAVTPDGLNFNDPNHFDTDEELDIVSPTGITVLFDKSGDGSITGMNSVSSMTFTEAYSYDVKYGLGSRVPSQIQLLDPILQTANIELEIENYAFEDTYRALDIGTNQDRSIVLEVRGENGSLNKFSMTGAQLVGENINTAAGDFVKANLTYRAYKPLINYPTS